MTRDAGGTWSNLTGNLATLVLDSRSIEFYSDGVNNVVLVGGRNGVFRTINPGVDPIWNKFGTGLPNAVVKDLHYYPAGLFLVPGPSIPSIRGGGDVLVAGTFGRGAWIIPEAGAQLIRAPFVVVDRPFPGGSFDVRLASDPQLPAVNVFVNQSKTPVYSVDTAVAAHIVVKNSQGGRTSLVLDSAQGTLNLPGGVEFNAGAGAHHRLEFSGGQFGNELLRVPARGSQSPGMAMLDGLIVNFTGIDQIEDLATSGQLTIDIPPSIEALNIVSGRSVTGMRTIQINGDGNSAMPTLTFANKTNLTVNALGGAHSITVNVFAGPSINTTLNTGGGTVRVITTKAPLWVQGVPLSPNGNTGILTLIGPNGPNVWTITGPDAGTLEGTLLGNLR